MSNYYIVNDRIEHRVLINAKLFTVGHIVTKHLFEFSAYPFYFYTYSDNKQIAAKQTSIGFDTAGTILSEKAREHIRLGHLGVTSGMKDRKHSNVTKQKMSLAGKGRKKTQAHKQAIGLANKGKPGRYGSSNPNAKGIVCLDTGVMYPTTKEASKTINRSASTITTALKNPHRTAGGFKWAYIK